MFRVFDVVLLGIAGPLAWASTAQAQVRWDVDGEVGAIERFTAGKASAAPSPGIGPALELQGHVAVIPMLRAGLYAAQDVSLTSTQETRSFSAAGLHIRIAPPLLHAPWKAWVSAGFGYVFTYASGYAAHDTVYGDTSGGMLEVPVGLGVSYKVRGPWSVFGELGGRFGVAFFGAMFDSQRKPLSGPLIAPYGGQDTIAVSLRVGVSFDR